MSPQIRPDRLRSVFLDLVGLYSPTGREEAALAFLEDFLAEVGCPYGVQPVDEERYNLILGRPDAPLVFVGHIDTVPAWDTEDIGPELLDGDWVRGLGTADMKGGCAAMIEAFLTLRELGLAARVGLALVVGEEEEGDGARAFLREARPGTVLVGEPTDLRLCAGHFGYLEIVASAAGRRAHASVPERGENAAEAVLGFLHALLQESELRGETGPVMSIRHLETSNPGFAVPERAKAWVDVHVPPDYPLERVKGLVGRAVAATGSERVSVEYPVAHEGFLTPDAAPIADAFRAAGGQDVDLFRSHSDANFFHEAGVSTLVLGPGSLEYAHSEEEGVSLAQVEAAARLYLHMGLARIG